MELGIGQRINNARRTVLARVSGLRFLVGTFPHLRVCLNTCIVVRSILSLIQIPGSQLVREEPGRFS